MKRCLVCNAAYGSDLVACPNCGREPSWINGVCSYAPEFAKEGDGFKSSYFSDLAAHEGRNFWFRARNRLVIWSLGKYARGFRSFLEIGCGTGFVLSGISQAFPSVELRGSELFVEGLGYAAGRLPSVRFLQMDARNIPFVEEFDVIGAFDVLEHVKEHERVLAQAHAALKSGGLLLLTVPQHDWMWSPVDEYACHERRYSAADLHRLLAENGFEIEHSTSFVSLLLPIMLLSRYFQKWSTRQMDPRDELKLPSALNMVLYAIMSVEVALIQVGLRFPIGGSRLVVARKI
jgi:SAM-dependent methyltransferase